MKIKISIIFLSFFLISSSYSKDDKLNFRGGKIGSENKRELRKPETAVKIDEDFLKYNPLTEIKELNRSEQYVSTLLKNVKLYESPQFRGSGKNIYAEYADSIFLIVSRDKNDSKKGGQGTGSLINKDGYIVTNYHVIENNLKGNIEVYTKPRSSDRKVGDQYIAQVELVSPSSDIAILKVKNLPKSVGSFQDLRIGDDVHAIGHPKSLYWSYTKGVVSQIRENFSWSSSPKKSATLIQTQTPISPGNSGGPLFSSQGKIVGVNTMKADGENLNFAVAIDEVNKILKNKGNYLNKNQSQEIVPKSKITSKKFPNAAKEEDFNKNGVIDTWYFDENKNGIFEKAFIDDDENGVIEAVVFDNDEDGRWDNMVIDTNGDGKGDQVRLYNKSGKLTHVGYDYNQDGKVDKWEKV
jgi:S1-C subfamily serine protease